MVRFTKMQGIGNDFVMIDAMTDDLPANLERLAIQLCDRRMGIGSDGLIVAERAVGSDFRMRMFNPDGSESEMCGNGIRCFAKLMHRNGHVAEDKIPISVETAAGILHVNYCQAGRIRVDMGRAGLTRREIGMLGDPNSKFVMMTVADHLVGTAVSMGNPHLVIFTELVNSVDLETIGPILEHHELFPSRVNVHFAQVLNRGEIQQRTWERGAGATLACGTGACACVVAACLSGLCGRKALVHLPGGDLEIEYAEDGLVYMTGPAEVVFDGEYPWD